VTQTDIEGLLVLEPTLLEDDRGFFIESWNARSFAEATGVDVDFVQDNHSRSVLGVLRGLHYQLPHAQGKLVRCIAGAVWDVAVDIRRSSATFKQSFGIDLTQDNHRQLWVPAGFAHGFLALSPEADLLYKTTEYYVPEADRAIRWDDPDLAVQWPLGDEAPIVSSKDESAPLLGEAQLFE